MATKKSGKPAESGTRAAAPAEARAPAAAKAARPPRATKPAKAPKAAGAKRAAPAPAAREPRKLVRDSFTMPKDEYAAIDALKARALGLGRPAKKSELLRAGLRALTAMTDRAFGSVLNAVPTLKTGRPKAEAPKGGAKKSPAKTRA